jgi:large subunit ribosomal protein L13
MKSYLAKPNEVERRWLIVDAEGQILGRLAVQIANALRGRNKPQYTPHTDTGDFVVVINADKVAVTGRKETDKIYQHYTGHMGGQKETKLSEVRAKHPERIIEAAVRRMLPKNKLARRQMGKLKAYAGTDHPHAAQNPQPMTFL